ncbi:uncharacterized protein METZ01_LOCUS99737 [marine metagenome]|uniref:Uncharacterized protein n=1 Tax=marine metagenome TaxID=408172 RepID=A0A381W4P7_9ZZZZ
MVAKDAVNKDPDEPTLKDLAPNPLRS